MAENNTSVSGDVLYQNGDDLSETNITRTAARSNATDYVERGLGATVDSAAGTVDINSGHCIIQDGINAYDVFPNQLTDVSLPAPNGTNHIYIQIDDTVDDQITFHVDDDDTPPPQPSLKIATADGSAGTSTPFNPNPDAAFGDVDADLVNTDGITLTAELSETIPFASGESKSRPIGAGYETDNLLASATPANDPGNRHDYAVDGIRRDADGVYYIEVTETHESGGGDCKITVWKIDES